MVSQHSAEKLPDPQRRSGRSHRAVLTAAATLLEEVGYANLTIQAIAERARVSNKTIYRWWPNKAAVVMEAFAEATADIVAVPNTGALHSDLLAFIRASFVAQRHLRFGATMANLVAAIQAEPSLAEAFRDEFIARRRDAVRQILKRASQREELREHVDIEVAIDGLYGPLFYRLLVGHAPLDEPFAEALTAQLLFGITKS